jgi:hypothetical protein
LNDEVTGVAGERPIFHRALRTRTEADHIAHFRKMVGDRMAALQARFLRLLNHGLEISEVEVFQHPRQIAGGPGIVAFRVDALDALERVAGGGDWQSIAHQVLLTEAGVQLKNELFTPSTLENTRQDMLSLPGALARAEDAQAQGQLSSFIARHEYSDCSIVRSQSRRPRVARRSQTAPYKKLPLPFRVLVKKFTRLWDM